MVARRSATGAEPSQYMIRPNKLRRRNFLPNPRFQRHSSPLLPAPAPTRRVSDPGPVRGGGATKRRHRREQIAAIPDQALVDRRPERDGPAVTLA